MLMDAGPDAFGQEPPLGASLPGELGLGPISPELALVDPELRRRALELLPEPRERPRPRRPVVATPAPEPEPPPEVPRRRRWPRALALAVVIFVAGAASGTLLGNHETSSPGTTLEVRALSPAATRTTAPRPALVPPKVSHAKPAAAAQPRRQRRRARIAWASNVLGVEATTSTKGVALAWQRPAGSRRVVVLRSRAGRSAVVVYRGRATSYRDASLRPCTGYRYTIVNYDRRGHRSTGVPTSVVTRCG